MSENDPHFPLWNASTGLNTTQAGDTKSSSSPIVNVRLKMDIYCILEILLVMLLGFVIAHYYVGGVLEFSAYLSSYIWSILGLPILMGLILQRTDMYRLSVLTDFAGGLGGTVWAVFAAFSVTALTATALGVTDNFSRIWFGFWFVGSIALLWTSRAIATRVFSNLQLNGLARRRVVLIGSEKAFKPFLERYDKFNPHYDFVFWFAKNEKSEKPTLKDEMQRLIGMWSSAGFDLVIVAPDYDNPEHLNFILHEIGMLSVEIKVLPPAALTSLPMLGVSSQGHHNFIDIQHSRVSHWGRFFKLVEDYTIATFATVLTSWLLLLIAIAIKLETPGPVFYRQQRTGLNNRKFSIFKFRTMAVERAYDEFKQTERVDMRVTRVGRFLRRTSLDELPQLFNVLKGEMSIVGPRPHPIELNEAYESQVHLFNKRHSVKPGITGWAQIHDHRGPIDEIIGMQNRLNHDLYYVDNWSIWFDIKIILATPFLILTHKNAY